MKILLGKKSLLKKKGVWRCVTRFVEALPRGCDTNVCKNSEENKRAREREQSMNRNKSNQQQRKIKKDRCYCCILA
jgi:hypothetical protein